MKFPNFSFEKKLWKAGYKLVAGVDEVGRGSFAGPVVAGCVVFYPSQLLQGEALRNLRKEGVVINDSKRMTPRQRERANKWIKENVAAWGVGGANVSLINRIGMGKATKVAFRRAIAEANLKLKTKDSNLIDFLLIDAFYIPYVRGLRRKNQKAIINGDEKSITIAAASIIAKVYRDALMRKMSHKYPRYGWGRNKGYGTREHQRALRKYGLSRYHRKQFVATYFKKTSSSQVQSSA